MLAKIFPIKLQLKILQLEGYELVGFLKWIFKNFFVRSVNNKKNLVPTSKLKLIIFLSIIFWVGSFLATWALTKNLLLSLVIQFLLTTQSYVFLVSSVVVLIPIQFLYIHHLIRRTRKKILSLKELKVIAITGSYGKSSTKEILYQLIKDKYKVLRTPESYNTILGISKVVDYELDDSYDFFVCEMAAYHEGDIKQLCYMIPPTFGILTGITEQHLEKFGSLRNIIKTKFELYNEIKNKDNIIFNLDDHNIFDEKGRRKIKNASDYLEATNILFSENGSQFEIISGNKKSALITKLFGYANIKNILGASSIALKLGLDFDLLTKGIKKLEPFPNRFKLTKYGKTIFIDNTFSSNIASFEEMLETAKSVQGKKVLVTPGLVELGRETAKIHQRLGKESIGIFDKIILVGKNNRTKSFATGVKEKTLFIRDSRADYKNTIEKLKDKYDWVFLENDVTENY